MNSWNTLATPTPVGYSPAQCHAIAQELRIVAIAMRERANAHYLALKTNAIVTITELNATADSLNRRAAAYEAGADTWLPE